MKKCKEKSNIRTVKNEGGIETEEENEQGRDSENARCEHPQPCAKSDENENVYRGYWGISGFRYHLC